MELEVLFKVLQQPQQAVVIHYRLCHSKMSKEGKEGLGQRIKDHILIELLVQEKTQFTWVGQPKLNLCAV